MIKAVIFDMGGVIAKTCWDSDYMAEVVEQIIRKYYNNVPENFKEVFKNDMLESWLEVRESLIEVSFEDVIRKTVNKLGLAVDDFVIKEAFQKLEEGEFCHVDENVETVLKTLKEIGIKLGLISNAPGEFPINVLKREGLDKYMDVMMTSYQIGVIKPHPKIFIEALKRLGVKPEETIFVGDVPEIDVKGAKMVGMIAVLMKDCDPVMRELGMGKITDNVKPDYIINSLEDVIEIVKKLNKNYSETK